ncbi:MAG: hypothetical protein U1F43_19055 [Myxococcota bacterium]
MCNLLSLGVLRNLRGGAAFDAARFGSSLDGLDLQQRIAATRALGKSDQAALWEVCQGNETSAEDFVPAHVPLGREVIHYGKNSLPLFSHFQKRFARAAEADTVYGYNWNGIGWTTAGPGYFIGHHDADMGHAFGLDYYHLPPSDAVLPAGWPAMRANEIGLQRFIYAEMIDYMRRVTDGVTIGRAWRKGKVTDNYFVLVRGGV